MAKLVTIGRMVFTQSVLTESPVQPKNQRCRRAKFAKSCLPSVCKGQKPKIWVIRGSHHALAISVEAILNSSVSDESEPKISGESSVRAF